MKTVNQLQTIAQTYQEICRGEEPWIALGNFMNDWFDYAKDRREQLVAEPALLPTTSDNETQRWATFCAASVEWLCQRYHVPCPSWVYHPVYNLSEPWYDSPAADEPEIREWLIQHTPEPFIRRNIYCGNRMFDNKYEFVERYRRLIAEQQAEIEGV